MKIFTALIIPVIILSVLMIGLVKKTDCFYSFKKGAEEALKIGNLYKCKKAILKEGSPSCGSSLIYDGTFKGKKISGVGVTTALLRKNGIEVISENDLI